MAKTSLSDQAIILISSRTLDAIILLASGMVLTRLLSQSLYGTYQQVILVVNTLAVLLPFGLAESIFFYYSKVSNPKRFLLQVFFLLNTIGMVGAALTFLLRRELGVFLSNPNLEALAISYISLVVFLTSNQVLGPMLLTQGKGKFLALLSSSFNLLFCISVILPLYLGLGLKQAVLMLTLAHFIQILFILIYILSMDGEVGSLWQWEQFRLQVVYSLPLGLSILVGILAKTVDKIVISNNFSPDQYAIYDRGALQLPLVSILIFTIGTVLLPRYVEYYRGKSGEKLLDLWYKSLRSVSLIAVPAFVVCLVLSKSIITFLYTDRYLQSVPIFRVFLLIFILTIPNYGALLRATNRTKYIMYSSILALALGSFLSIILVRQFGIIGPAWGFFASAALVNIYYAHVVKKTLQVNWSQLFPWKVLGQIGLIALLTGIICYPLVQLNLPKLATLTLVSLVYGGLYLGFLLTFRMLRVEDKAILKRWLTLQALRPEKN